MVTSITAITGIGTATAKILVEEGYNSVEAIAAAKVEELVQVHGFGRTRAQQIIELARDLLDHGTDQNTPDPIKTSKKKEKKKDKKKKKKKKEEKKQGKKEKKKKKGKKKSSSSAKKK